MIVAVLAAAGLVAALVLGAAWVGYPLLLRVLAARSRVKARPGTPGARGAVSAIIATREPPEVVRDRVRDLRAGDYPDALLEVVVGVDARAPHDVAAYGDALAGLARVVRGDEPGGKAAALNAAVRASSAPVLLFADSRQSFSRDAIGHLMAGLDDARFGAVSGAVLSPDSGDGLMNRYWEIELGMRRAQADLHSIICVSGAIYVLRRELWRPMPDWLICDDLFVTMHVARSGLRVGFAPGAHAHDDRRFTREQHFDRKVRTLTGLLQLCAWEPAVLRPATNPIWGHFVVHKLVRLVTPYLAVLVVLGAAAVAVGWLGVPWWALVLVALAPLVPALLLLALRPALARRVATTLGWLLRLQLVPVLALRNGVRGRWQVWTPAAAPTPPHAPPDEAVA